MKNKLEPTGDEILRMMPYVDIFLPSWSEIGRIWPGAAPAVSIRRLRSAAHGPVVIKMGAKGCIGTDGERLLAMPSLSTNVVDTTGAGDAFCGASNAKWFACHDLGLAMAWGSAAASAVIEDFGALHAVNGQARKEAEKRSAWALSSIREQ